MLRPPRAACRLWEVYNAARDRRTSTMAAPFAFDDLTTPHIADACLRLDVPLRVAPGGIRPLVDGSRLAGRVLPVRHYGSVDVFFEALEGASTGDVLVIDNGGRVDEGCIGDLTALEVRGAGVRGIVLWGFHRDSAELRRIPLP